MYYESIKYYCKFYYKSEIYCKSTTNMHFYYLKKYKIDKVSFVIKWQNYLLSPFVEKASLQFQRKNFDCRTNSLI